MNRGDVHRIRPHDKVGHEQRGARFGVIVQTDALASLSTVIVAPTSMSAQPASFRPVIDIDGTSTRVLLDQLAAIDVSRVGRRHGRLDIEAMWAIDEAIRTVLVV